ncbi:hypothetical protein SAY86_007041 [Trapa natans]|uniref:C2H2-type domain-containing protein n=1 Tax=Trapa natans TaxID=22666 RepID=A0AAN7LA40_TRANT|nr:hypothetical protein SAY86_007041 [Trapa natans]
MEKNNGLSKTVKDHLVGSNAVHSHLDNPVQLLSSNKLVIHHGGGCQTYGRSEDDYLTGISWPPRSYSCSFCKREFRSAQALGGHMNVHRRDRARLRQSSPDVEDLHQHPFLSLSTNPSPSPNPNPNRLSPASSASPSLLTNRHPLVSSSAASPPPFPPLFSMSSSSVGRDLLGNLGLKSRASEPKPKTVRGASIRVLEMGERYKYLSGNMEIDLLGGSNNDYIDLELRLGCP